MNEQPKAEKPAPLPLSEPIPHRRVVISEARRAAIRKHYRALRNEVEKTQLQVETLARLDAGRYWKIENGFVFPTDTERKALAKVLKVAESELPNEHVTEARATA